MWNIMFLSVGAIFVFMLFTVFFTKEHIKFKENQYFKYLILINAFEYLIEIPLQLFVRFVDKETFVRDLLFPKLYLISIFTWFSIFSIYTFIICLNKNDEKKYEKKFSIIRNINLLVWFIGTSLLAILPFEKFHEADKMYIYGPAVDILKIFLGIYMIIWIYLLLKNIKNLKDKKYVPIFLIIVLLILNVIIQTIDPSILIASMVGTLICYTMYFTIENPDMKLLKEVHRAKEISDNANEEKTLFLYNMTNDIRSITKDIDDSADYILDEIDNKKVDKELIKETARDIKSSTAKFTTMTNEILDISSIDTSSIKVYNNKYNIKLLLKQLVTNYKEKCHSKGLTFRSNIDTTLPEYLYGDSVSLKKVIDILLENSYKYTDNGYIELSVNTIIKNNIARLIITVEDSGTGMKVEELNKAINTKKEEDSTNLNNSLYNAKKLITLMNGTIVPYSTYGSGTSIKIILDQKVYEEKSKTSKYNKELDKKRVLLVDDNISSQKLFTKILSGTNIELDIVSLGKECLDKIRNKEKYDLILLDEEMKPLSGIEVITKLKNIKNFNTKVVLLTKNNDYEYNEDYLKYGFIDYILKPLDKIIVLDKIGKYLK